MLFCLLSFTIGQAQVSKTINVSSAGTLYNYFTSSELYTVTNLTVTGSINAADFVIMRDSMKVLASVDLSGTSIEAFTGKGTNGTGTYNANEIPVNAFYNSETYVSKVSLVSVILPNFVTSIGADSFHGCKSLTSIILPPQTTLIGDNAFLACKGLTTLTIPQGVTSIGVNSFYSCSGLTGTLNIPNSVTSIGKEAFAFCTSLSTITIPFSVSTISDQAFLSCSGNIVVDSDNVYYSSLDGVLFDKTQTKLISFPLSKGGSYSIPNTVTFIGDYAFMYNTLLTSISIPSSVITIGNYTFCKSRGLTTISIPPSVVVIGNFGFASNSNLISVNIPSSVTTIGNSVFFACTGLKSITIPSSVISIGGSVFNGCTNLMSVYTNAAAPVDLSSSTSVFLNVPKTTCSLYVPIGSLNLYKAANQWKDFTNMVENITAVPTTINEKIKISLNSQTNILHINGINEKYNLNILDINGREVITKSGITGEYVKSFLLPLGIYILKLNFAGNIIERKIIKK